MKSITLRTVLRDWTSLTRGKSSEASFGSSTSRNVSSGAQPSLTSKISTRPPCAFTNSIRVSHEKQSRMLFEPGGSRDGSVRDTLVPR